MTPARTRALALLTGIALLPAGLVATSTPASGVENTTTVTFTGCDIRTERELPTTRIGDNFSWSPSLRLRHPSPVRTDSDQRIAVSLGDFPVERLGLGSAGLSDVEVYVQVDFEHSDGGASAIHLAYRPGSVPATGTLALGEGEYDVYTPSTSQLQTWAPLGIRFALYGTDAADTRHERFLKCDPIAQPRSALTVAIFDPAAKASLRVSPAAAAQGSAVKIVARDFAPGETVTAYLGARKLVAFTADTIGAVAGIVKVPDATKPGTQTLKLVGSANGETAAAALKVLGVVPSAAITPKAVKRGTQATLTGAKWVPNETVKAQLTLQGKSKQKGKKAQAVTAKASTTGALSKKFKVKKSLAPGTYKVAVVGLASGRTAKIFTIKLK